MNAASPNITPLDPASGNMDFAALRSAAISFLQQHNTELWTDYNYHDPGVTILEQVCFALTDLAFRTNFSMADLLQKQGSNINTAFPASLRLLNAFPVRKIDIRKVILDSLPAGADGEPISNKIYNTWVIQEADNVYSVEIQLNTQSNKKIEKNNGEFDPEKKTALENEIKQALGAFRGLCTDFGKINILQKEDITITGNVNIKNGYTAEKVLASIYTRIDVYLNPSVPFYTLDELLAQKIPVARIFEGPALKKGFVLDSDLQAPDSDPDTSKPRLTTIDVSEISTIIFATEGVSAIGNILVNGKADEYTLGGGDATAEKYFPLLKTDLVAGKILTISKNGSQVDIGSLNKLKYNTFLSELNPKRTKPASDQQFKDNFKTDATFRDPGKYYSMQKYFPMVYGIGDYGLPGKVFVNETGTDTPQTLDARQAQANQLKAYLMLFEQIIANYLSQLANIENLFSTAYSSNDQTYFYQSIIDNPSNPKSNNVPNGITIVGTDGWGNYSSDLQKNAEDDQTFLTRKEMFLDHLLARVNETMDSYPFRLYDLVYKGTSLETRESKLLSAKAAYLDMYDTIGYNRNRAFNYYSKSLSTQNISGLELKIGMLLGINNLQKRELHKIDKLAINGQPEDSEKKRPDRKNNVPDEIVVDISITEQIITDNGIVIEYHEDDELIISEGRTRRSKNDYKGFHFDDAGSRGLNTFLRDGLFFSNYRIGKHKNKKNNRHYFITFFNIAEEKGGPAKPHWIKIHTHTNLNIAKEKLSVLVSYALEVNTNSEGFHLIEHLLLRDGKPYKVSVVLPLWPARFQDAGFQDYVQQLFIKQAPLYIQLNFIWLDWVYMKEFETKYFPWLAALAKDGPQSHSPSGNKLKEFLKKHSGNN